MAWGWRISGRRGPRRSRRRWTRRGGWRRRRCSMRWGRGREAEVEAQGVPAGQVTADADAAAEGEGDGYRAADCVRRGGGDAARRSAAAHRARFGFDPGEAAALVIEAAQAEAVGAAADLGETARAVKARPEASVAVALRAPVFLGGAMGRGAVRAARGVAAGGPGERAGGAGGAAYRGAGRAGVAGAGHRVRSCGAGAGGGAGGGGMRSGRRPIR